MVNALKGLVAVGLVAAIAMFPPPVLSEAPAPRVPVNPNFDAVEPSGGLPAPSVSLTGIAPANSKVVIKAGEVVLQTTTTMPNKKWIAHLPPLKPGEHKFTVESGSYSTQIEVHAFDPNRPTILLPATLGRFGPTVELSGLVDPNTTLRILQNGTEIAKVEANHLGVWAYTADAKKGTNVFTAKTTGAHASVSGYRGPRTTIPPVLIKVQPMGGTLLVRGIAAPFNRVAIRNKGKLVGETQANANGQWTFTFRGRMLGAQFEVGLR